MALNKRELLDQLFVWKRETQIKAADGTVITTVYQRIVGDFDLQSARKTALRYSMEARKRINNPASDDHIIYILPLKELSREDKVTLCLSEELDSIRKTVDNDVFLPEPVEPDPDASPEEFEEYQRLDDTYEQRRAELLSSKLTEAINRREEELKDLSDDEIDQILITARVNAYCSAEMRVKFIEYCTCLGTFIDEKYRQRLYPSFNDFLELPENLKQQLIEGYLSLEMNAVALKEYPKTPALEAPSAQRLIWVLHLMFHWLTFVIFLTP